MSGRYSRTYSRGKKTAPPPISQFDKLVTNDSVSGTRPSVTKTAGHVGKWGITSFTSLRNIQNGLGNESNKRSYPDDSPPPTIIDDFEDTNGASLQVKPPGVTYSKPRKFFKSRNNDCAVDTVRSNSTEKPHRGKVNNTKSPPPVVTIVDTPDSGQESDNVPSPSPVEILEEKIPPPKPVRSESVSSSKSGSIKLKIFKSRNVASCSQETYSSTVELPSDDSRANSASTSVASSPSTKDYSEENRDSSEERGSSPQPEYKASQINIAAVTARATTVISPERLGSPDRTINSTFDSSYEFTGLVDQRTGLPLDVSDSENSFSENQSKCPTSQINNNNGGRNVKTYSSKVTKSSELNKYLAKNMMSSTSDIDTGQNNVNDTVCDTSLGEDIDLPEIKFGAESTVFGVPEKLSSIERAVSPAVSSTVEPLVERGISPVVSSTVEPLVERGISLGVSSTVEPLVERGISLGVSSTVEPLVERGISPGVSSAGGDEPSDKRGISPAISSAGEGEIDNNIDLFSTDFDENKIEDRTKIDVSNIESIVSKDPTEDAEDTFSSQVSFPTVKRADSRKSESESVKSEQPPPLVKKRSIFKSRDQDRDAKKRATYKHKWHDHDQDKDEDAMKEPLPLLPNDQIDSANDAHDPYDDFDDLGSLERVQSYTSSTGSLDDSQEMQSVTSVKCSKGAKQFYTVVKNVKRTHQLQESGEFQEFNDDVEYFLDALRSSMPVSTRCLAALNLAQKCMVPAFRMHLRAHGTVIKFFNSLSDAHTDHKLAICTATVMFTLSQDHLNMDLDRDSLELMLNILESDAECTSPLSVADSAMVEQNRKKIQELCQDMQKKGHAKHLDLDNINAGHLAMETLLSLTSKRAGEWFKEELRELGGVEHLIRTISLCTKSFTPDLETWTMPLLEKLTKVDRCLKVLENVTHQNNANQEYLLTYEKGIFPEHLVSLYQLCHVEVPLYPVSEADAHNTSIGGVSTGQLLIKTLVTTVKVLINLTHNAGKEALGSKVLGHQQEIYNITLYCILIMPKYVNQETRFELLILSCSLLLNLVEHSKKNREILMKTKAPDFIDDSDNIFQSSNGPKGAMQALVELFYRCEESARQQEARTDEIIDQDLAKQQKEDEKKDDEIEETVARLLQKAGHHMEDTLIAAYTALITGYCIMDDEDCESKIRAMLPDAKFCVMVTVIKKFLRFMDLTATTSLLRSLKPTERVVKYMEKLDDNPVEEADQKDDKEDEEEDEMYAFGF